LVKKKRWERKNTTEEGEFGKVGGSGLCWTQRTDRKRTVGEASRKNPKVCWGEFLPSRNVQGRKKVVQRKKKGGGQVKSRENKNLGKEKEKGGNSILIKKGKIT